VEPRLQVDVPQVRVIDAKAAVVTPVPAENGADAAVAAPGAGKEAGQPGGDSQVVKARTRTYFINVKLSKTSEKYLTITESEGAGKESHHIMVFADHVDEFADAVERAMKSMK
jgi:hypothetical protein